MKNLFKKCSSLSDDLKDRNLAEAYIERLVDYYHTYQEHHKAIMAMEGISSEHEYLKKKTSIKGEVAYYLAKADFKGYIASLEEDKSLNGTLRSPRDFDFGAPKTQATPVDIPKFIGEQSDWVNFRDIYEGYVHNVRGHETMEKYFCLRTHVSGKTLEIIRDLSLNDQGYGDAWKELKEFYENKRSLTNSHMHDLLTVKPMKSESSSALRKLMRDISVPQDALELLETASWDNLIVYLTARNFDEATQKDWQKSVGSLVEHLLWSNSKNLQVSASLL